MARAEFWVMRVMLHPGGHATRIAVRLDDMTAAAAAATLAAVALGKLCLLPDGVVAEPTEVFDDQHEAHAHRAVLMRRHPSEEFRVVLNTELVS